MQLKLRPWLVKDASFVCKMRNNPKLMKWFRQDQPILLKDQQEFIKNHVDYQGQIIELNDKRIGVFAIKTTGELAVVLNEEDYKYLPQLLKDKRAWGEGFVGNPILKYLLNAGFVTVGIGYWNERPLIRVRK